VAAAEQAALLALLEPAGRELLDRLPPGPLEPARALRLGVELRAAYPAELVAAALTLHGLRVRAGAKFTLAERMWFTREGLEQASSERAAAHRAARFHPYATVADLCTGIGGDLLALAAGRAVLAVDLDPVRLRLAFANAEVHGVSGRVRPRCADARDVPLHGVGAVFVDPARRAGGRRLRAGASEPPLPWCLGLAQRVAPVAVKAAPGLPLGLVPAGWEAELVSEGRELKEAVLWSPALATARRRATLLPEGRSLVAEPGPPVPCRIPGGWLVDPDPAVTRAGLVEELARTLDAWKLDEQGALLACAARPATAFGRVLRVEAALPWQLKRLRALLRARRVGTVDVRKRGSAVDVDELRRRLRLTGDARATVVLTRVAGRPWALVCSDP
jgi:hypothetical protein